MDQYGAVHHPMKLTHRYDPFHTGQRPQLRQRVVTRQLDEDGVGHRVHRAEYPRLMLLEPRAHELLLAA